MARGPGRGERLRLELALMNPGRREMSAMCWGHPGVGMAYREGGQGAAGAWDEDGGRRRAGACHTRGETSVCSLQAADWVPMRDMYTSNRISGNAI